MNTSLPPLQPAAGAALALSIGQHVRMRDRRDNGDRITGTVRSIGIEDNALWVTVALDEPIVIPAMAADERDIHLRTQHVPAHELHAFDARDEVIEDLQRALRNMLAYHDHTGALAADQRLLDAGYAALARTVAAA